MKKYLIWVVLLITAFGFVTWTVARTSPQVSKHEILLEPNSRRLEPGASSGGVLARKSIISERSPAKIPAGIFSEKRLRGRKKTEPSPYLFFAQLETLACDDGVLWDVDYNGVDEWNEAVRLGPSQPCSLIALLYWPSDPDSEAPNLTWGVWDDDGPGGFPSTLLDNGTVGPNYDQWFRIDLGTPIFVPSGEIIYIGWLDENSDPYYVNGLDAVLDSCNYWYDGMEWVLDPWFDGDFMIRGICEQLPGAYKDVMPTSINEPAVAVPQGTSLNPRATIENLGSGPATFDIICNIDSLGSQVLVYSDSVHMTSLAGTTDTAVSFPKTWNAANASGIHYQTTVYTMLSGDDNPLNDTLTSTTVTYDPSKVIQSPYTASPPTIDGFLTPGEWSGATTRDVSDLLGTPDANDPFGSAAFYVMNDAANLYMAVDGVADATVDDFDQIALYFDDNNDHAYPSAPDTSEGNYWLWKTAGNDSLSHRWIQAGGVMGNEYLVGFPGAIGITSGHQQFELQVPLGTLAQELNASDGDTVGFFLLTIDGFNSSLYGWWPYDTDPTTGWYTPSEYGDIILEPAPIIHDGGVVSINAPPDTALFDTTYTPEAVIQNFGNVLEDSFDVECLITPGYADTQPVLGLDSGNSTTVSFANWTASDSITYNMCVTTLVSGDANANNDSLCKDIVVLPTVFHDGGVISKESPPDTVLADSTYQVEVTVANFGDVSETFAVDFIIPGTYAETETVFNLGSGSTTSVLFANDWTVPSAPDSFWYIWSSCTQVIGDNNNANDCLMDSIFAWTDTTTGVEEGWRAATIPTVFVLRQSNPNPFHQRTEIRYQVPEKAEVSLKVYDLGGRLVRTLRDETQEPGYYTVAWDGKDQNESEIPSGIYLYRLKAGEFLSTRKLIMLR